MIAHIATGLALGIVAAVARDAWRSPLRPVDIPYRRNEEVQDAYPVPTPRPLPPAQRHVVHHYHHYEGKSDASYGPM